MEINFLWLGGTTIENMTLEINISKYARTVRKYNTKGYQIVPYSGWLKYNFLSKTANKESMIYINVLEISYHI